MARSTSWRGKSLRLPDRGTLARWLRFALVGGLAALAYLAVSVGCFELGLIGARPVAIGVGLAISFAIAYLGHHGFTYRRKARHAHYLGRFIAAQIVIGGLMVGMVLGLSAAGMAYWMANALLVVVWPLVNLAVSDLWTFTEPPQPPAR